MKIKDLIEKHGEVDLSNDILNQLGIEVKNKIPTKDECQIDTEKHNMKNFMEEVANMLGVELEEDFWFTDKANIETNYYSPYKLTEDGLVDRDGDESSATLTSILTGELKIRMKNQTTIKTKCMNGYLVVGDVVLVSPKEGYGGALVGTVIDIVKAGTPEHAQETGNDSDNVHVNCLTHEYTDFRKKEITNQFGYLYHEPMDFEQCPIDDVIYDGASLCKINKISKQELSQILSSYKYADAYYELQLIRNGKNTQFAI